MVLFLAEMEGFEPPHALRRLADFDSAPFSHLGTSPETTLLYQRSDEKSRLFLPAAVLFCQFQHFPHFLANGGITFPPVGPQAGGTIFDTAFCISEISAAAVAQTIQRTVAKQAAEGCRVCRLMAGKIFTFSVLKKIIMAHMVTLPKIDPITLFHNAIHFDLVFQNTAVALNRLC